LHRQKAVTLANLIFTEAWWLAEQQRALGELKFQIGNRAPEGFWPRMAANFKKDYVINNMVVTYMTKFSTEELESLLQAVASNASVLRALELSPTVALEFSDFTVMNIQLAIQNSLAPVAEPPPTAQESPAPAPVVKAGDPGFTLAALAAEVEIMKSLLNGRDKAKVTELVNRYFYPEDLKEIIKTAGSLAAIVDLFIEHEKDIRLLKTLNELDFKLPPLDEASAKSLDPERNRAIINVEQQYIVFVLTSGRPMQFRLVHGKWYLKN
jgi:hypothetical protein